MVFNEQPQNSDIWSREIIPRVNNDSRRLRVVESRLDNMREKLGMLDEGLLIRNKEIAQDINKLSEEIRRLSNEMSELKTESQDIKKKMNTFAPKQKIAEMETFIQMVDPLQLVTREDVEKIVKKILNK